ncbi:MAG: hypothetical protein Q4C47_09220, partial [Planctomycetia bacterium]|nr:hypothetical protein [Planctomycetia bacterium]
VPDVVRYVLDYSEGSPSFSPVDYARDPIPFEIYDTGGRPSPGGDLELDVSGGGGGEAEDSFTGGLYDPGAVGEDVLEEWERGGAGPAIAWDGA